MKHTGKGERRILFVAEAPGETEDMRGVQLVGDAGKLLRRTLHEIGEELDDCWKTNCVICRPPKNEIRTEYIEACRPNLLRTIKELKPAVIIILGASPVDSLIPLEWHGRVGGLAQWVGWTIPSSLHNAWLCPTYHPSYINRMKEDPLLMLLFKQHLKSAMNLENKPVPSSPLKIMEEQVEVILNQKDARLRMKDMATKTGILAFDYETTGLKPEREEHEIISCSFCFNGEETFACLINKENIHLLSEILLSKRLKKVASNLKFEERWTVRKLGHGVANWHWDTMLAAHILDNRSGITGLKFQSFIRFGIGDYSSHIAPMLSSDDSNGLNRIKEIPASDLLLYNGLDSLLEYKVMEQQKTELERSGLCQR